MTLSDKTKLLILYRGLSPEDQAIVDRVIMKIQLSPKKSKQQKNAIQKIKEIEKSRKA